MRRVAAGTDEQPSLLASDPDLFDVGAEDQQQLVGDEDDALGPVLRGSHLDRSRPGSLQVALHVRVGRGSRCRRVARRTPRRGAARRSRRARPTAEPGLGGCENRADPLRRRNGHRVLVSPRSRHGHVGGRVDRDHAIANARSAPRRRISLSPPCRHPHLSGLEHLDGVQVVPAVRFDPVDCAHREGRHRGGHPVHRLRRVHDLGEPRQRLHHRHAQRVPVCDGRQDPDHR